ncbi:hypothetical protein M758_5G173700 [Ceratodon purpureus]|nr:hypothetical protein M758_5G173700 [Ceratodon purpureus]
MRNVKKAKHGPALPVLDIPQGDVDSEEEESEVEVEGEMEGDDGSMSVEEEMDPEAVKYIEQFKIEVIEDTREKCDGKGLEMAKDLSAGAPQRFLEWVVSPMKLEKFQEEFWEQRPFLIRRPKNRNYYDGLFDKATIEKLLENHELKYGLNIDVTKYDVDGGRSTYSSEASATSSKVWSKYADGWSVRILHPQRWCDPVFLILSAFERFWGSVAGCNAYLTPAGSQGFSPHYDDIEAFVIQTEGKKRWKVYKPRTPAEALPRFSSPNFEQSEIGEPILDVDLEPGDILYMPRGTIHQAKASPDTHSLHITVSVGQRNCWGDFLELAMPRALELASEDHIILRESLPRGYADYMGVAHSDEHENPQRAAFIEKVMECMARVSQSIPWDSAADQLAVKFLQARLPLPGQEASKPPAKSTGKITGKSKVRLVAPDVARLVLEGDAVVVYHMLKNSRDAHNEGDQEEAEDPEPGKRLVFTWEVAPALEELLSAFPEPVEVSSLAVSGEEIVTLVTELCDHGILVKV